MYDGKQVVRVETQYKKDDLYNIGVEMTNRKGTGNYSVERKEFNYEYVSLTEKNLYQEVKKNLKDRKIEFNNKSSTNMLVNDPEMGEMAQLELSELEEKKAEEILNIYKKLMR